MCFYSGFKRNVLTSGVEEMCLKNGSVEPARPCCFPVLRPGFRTPGLLLSTADHRNVSQTFVSIAFREHLPLTTAVAGNVARKCVSKMGPLQRPGYAVPLQEQFGC